MQESPQLSLISSLSLSRSSPYSLRFRFPILIKSDPSFPFPPLLSLSSFPLFVILLFNIAPSTFPFILASSSSTSSLYISIFISHLHFSPFSSSTPCFFFHHLHFLLHQHHHLIIFIFNIIFSTIIIFFFISIAFSSLHQLSLYLFIIPSVTDFLCIFLSGLCSLLTKRRERREKINKKRWWQQGNLEG